MNTTLVDIWDDPARPWPTVVYVETTNHCNAHCICCLNDRCQRIRGVMDLDTFKQIAYKVREHGLMIGAMFCFGEPLIDPTLEEKYEYANSLEVMHGHVGLNTNCTFLTPNRFDGILAHVHNLTLSFFNVGREYECLTGLSWKDSYNKARAFIRYRDEHKPDYPIAIGVNTVQGHNLGAVRQAFTGQRVMFVQDAELRWGGSVITGVLDRTIMYPSWRCDGMKGALQIKWNGDCEFCAYDIIGSPRGGETLIGNILTDSWKTLEASFRSKWKSVCSLCARCDYWHHAKEVIALKASRPNPLPKDWYDWQVPFLKEGESFCD